MYLDEVASGAHCEIVRVNGDGAFRKRILEMGFVQGQRVEKLGAAPLGDPTMYRVMGYLVSLRREEAHLVEVRMVSAEEREACVSSDGAEESGVSDDEGILEPLSHLKGQRVHPSNRIRVALVGNPNSGKTSLFNLASGAKERTGNYSGVTIDAKAAHIDLDAYRIELVDLPGTYSLTAYSPEELYVRRFIFDEQPDVIINVVDTNNLERNLYLTLQLLETGSKVVVALNMWDEFSAQGHRMNRPLLSEQLGAPCIPTQGRTGQGLVQLLRAAISVHQKEHDASKQPMAHYDAPLLATRDRVVDLLRCEAPMDKWEMGPLRYAALKLVEGDAELRSRIARFPHGGALLARIDWEVGELRSRVQADPETYATDVRYAYIGQCVRRACAFSNRQRGLSLSKRIDLLMTNRIWGIPIFFGLMWLMFFITFTVGQYPMDWIEMGVEWFGGLVSGFLSEGPLRDLLVDGVIGGVGSVIVFLPQILILFFCIALLEDSGYMARAVFLMDRVMRGVGLHGRSFIPLLMGFGCNVPSVMATRTIRDRKVRMSTMLVNPFMSCSARLQAYVLLVGAAFPHHQVSALFSIYLLGIVVACVMALLLRRSLLRGNDSPFVLELPPYRMPTARASLGMMWGKAVQYLRKMGGIILVASVAIWFLDYYPRPSDAVSVQVASAPSQSMGDSLRALPSLAQGVDGLEQGGVGDSVVHLSYLARMGKAIEPAILPLGFDWRIGVGLVSGIAAKEVVVSTLGVILQTGDDDDEGSLLKARLGEVRYDSGPRIGQKLFTPLSAASLLLFVALYVPCIAVIAAIRKEAGSWKWAIFAAVYTTAFAYVVSLAVYQIGSLFVG